MELTLYQIDAFADKPFEGNPAAICPLDSWLPDETLQAIAEENNLAETAYFVPKGKGFHIRWFTPLHEVKLCGHATLASAYVLFDLLNYKQERIEFESRSGQLIVYREDDWYVMDFPSQPPIQCSIPDEIIGGLGKTPIDLLESEDYMAVFENEADILSIDPDFGPLKKLKLRGVIVTAPGKEVDFVSRFFAPKLGINEDPVTGSAHCELTPYWANRINKNRLTARQLSKRGGELVCELRNDRIFIYGKAVKYLEGRINITSPSPKPLGTN
jgi:PhzF family phenazine biosynthesis protein